MKLIRALLTDISGKDGKWRFYRNHSPISFFAVKDAGGKVMDLNLMRRWTGKEWEYRSATPDEIGDYARSDAW